MIICTLGGAISVEKKSSLNPPAIFSDFNYHGLHLSSAPFIKNAINPLHASKMLSVTLLIVSIYYSLLAMVCPNKALTMTHSCSYDNLLNCKSLLSNQVSDIKDISKWLQIGLERNCTTSVNTPAIINVCN